MKTICYLFIAGFFLSACEKQDTFVKEELIGVYINSEYSDSLITFNREDVLPENDYAIQFKTNGKLIERNNAGWCGTPPITYDNFEGSWKREKQVVDYTVEFWGGTRDIKWEIISLDDQILKVKLIEQTIHMTE